MSTKNDPGEFDCYRKLADDEPYFVLRAKDPDAPTLVRLWATRRRQKFGDCAKFDEAITCAAQMETWKRIHSPEVDRVTSKDLRAKIVPHFIAIEVKE